MRSSPASAATSIKQGRTRQVEIGQQHVDRAEAVAGHDEQSGVAGKGPHIAVLGCGGFEEAQARRSDRDDAPALAPRRGDPFGGLGRNNPPFGVHRVIARIGRP